MGMSSSTQKDDQPTTTTTKKHIFILSDQSNMVGRGGIKNKHWDVIVPCDCKPDPSIIHLLNANLIWETAQEPLHTDIDTNKIYGNAVKGYINGVIDLVQREKLYEDMVKRAKSAASSGGDQIDALVPRGKRQSSDSVGGMGVIRLRLHLFDAKYVEVVREAQKEIDIANVVYVDAKGLELKEDNLI
ncbi:hypothetical protein L6452_34229 [Arctium lappa]|uniref:Uncharacterized protein n=1 Tax=Arctium lappa TaxID=4217 RepID=A0ACB8YI83_ARCLA|nr:hypothetical protein L6452_34229 [Arctium lappa]